MVASPGMPDGSVLRQPQPCPGRSSTVQWGATGRLAGARYCLAIITAARRSRSGRPLLAPPAVTLVESGPPEDSPRRNPGLQHFLGFRADTKVSGGRDRSA